MMLRRLVAVILLLYKGVWECLKDCSDFESFEKQARGQLARAGCEVLSMIFEALDERLMQERDPNLRVVGFRDRTIVTLFGEMKLRRRLYEDKVTGEMRFLLDERLGLEKRDRVSAGVKELAVRLSTEMSFRQAADVLAEMTPGISPMTAWNIVKEAGEEATLEGQRLRERVFERAEDPGGKREAEKLHIEADGVSIAIQRSPKKRDEVKVGTAYEGKETEGNRVRLKERRVMAGVLNEGAFWEEALARVAEHWDVGGLKGVVVGGDGAPWVKKGTEYFENAEYRLDKFHLRKAIRQALGHDPEGYEETCKALSEGDLDRVKACLKKAEERAKGSKRQGIQKFRRYLLDNWDGIKESGEIESLGAIEGQIFHHIARRMKRRGASWSEEGADRMSRLLAAKANGELSRYTREWCKPWKPVPAVSPQAEQFNATELDTKAEEIGAWLRARVPALSGPCQSSLFVKYVLREIVFGSKEGIWVTAGRKVAY